MGSAVSSAAAQSPVPDDAVLERIAEGFEFVEGPLWKDGALLFSDIPANTIYRWTPGEGVAVAVRPSSNSNGLALDAEERLLIAQHGARRVARMEADGTQTALATHFQGKRLNSPNDLAVHPDGSIYFTDPPWGIQPEEAELDFWGVYRLAPDGSLHLLLDSLHKPNGIVFSPDHETVYVSTSDEREVYAFDVDRHTLTGGRLFASQAENRGAFDGMVVDPEGNLYVTGPGGLWIYAPDGALLDRIPIPGQTSNVAWGDADGRTLYITSGNGVYRLRVEG